MEWIGLVVVLLLLGLAGTKEFRVGFLLSGAIILTLVVLPIALVVGGLNIIGAALNREAPKRVPKVVTEVPHVTEIVSPAPVGPQSEPPVAENEIAPDPNPSAIAQPPSLDRKPDSPRTPLVPDETTEIRRATPQEIYASKVPFHLGELQTNSGKRYFDVVVSGKTAKGIRIFHRNGAAVVPFEEVDPAFLQGFNASNP